MGIFNLFNRGKEQQNYKVKLNAKIDQVADELISARMFNQSRKLTDAKINVGQMKEKIDETKFNTLMHFLDKIAENASKGKNYTEAVDIYTNDFCDTVNPFKKKVVEENKVPEKPRNIRMEQDHAANTKTISELSGALRDLSDKENVLKNKMNECIDRDDRISWQRYHTDLIAIQSEIQMKTVVLQDMQSTNAQIVMQKSAEMMSNQSNEIARQQANLSTEVFDEQTDNIVQINEEVNQNQREKQDIMTRKFGVSTSDDEFDRAREARLLEKNGINASGEAKTTETQSKK